MKKTKNKQTERDTLLSIFNFFQVPVKIYTNGLVRHKQGTINAAGRRFVFDDDGRIARVIENGKIVKINEDF